MSGTYITITTPQNETFSAYLIAPPSGRGPGILVIQEVFGINHVMRAITQAFAEAGYAAICPDLFWRQQPGVELSDKTEAEWERALELYRGFDEARGVEDIKATLEHLRSHPACTGAAGCVGYCLGGKLAYLMATRSNVDCSVSYYGVGIENALGEADNVRSPLLMHIAERDGFVPPEAQGKIKARLGQIPHVTMHSYPGVDHAFARPGGQNYVSEAAQLANRRTREFFKAYLS